MIKDQALIVIIESEFRAGQGILVCMAWCMDIRIRFHLPLAGQFERGNGHSKKKKKKKRCVGERWHLLTKV